MLLVAKLVYDNETKKPSTFIEGLWHHPGSNRGHKDFQSFALPTELQRHCIVRGANIGQDALNSKK